MKKTFLIVGALVFFGLAPHVFAQGFVPLTNIPGLTSGAVADTTGLANFLNNLYKYLIGLAAILAVIEIIWGGLEISTQDSVSKKSDGKERITQAILGLILVLSPVLVFSIINPSILNLSLDLPELNTGTPIELGGGAAGGMRPAAPAIGCSAPSGGLYLQTFACANADVALSDVSCRDGLAIRLPVCKKTDAGSGKCLDNPYYVYCAGKESAPLVFYAYTTFKGL